MSKDVLYSLTQGALIPQEEAVLIKPKNNQLVIGIPKEIAFQENRIPLVPDAVALLINNGHRIIIEKDAGRNANFDDHDFSEAGAEIASSAQEVYEKSSIILKIAPPTMDELEWMKPKQILFSALQLSVQPKDFLKKIISKKLSCVAYELVTDGENYYPFIRAMGEIAGGTSILIAAELLSNINGGPGFLLGGITGITPTEVVIIGAGTVGEYAARAALGLGATVKVFDNSIYRLRRLQASLGNRIFTSIIVPRVLEKHLRTADVVIGALRAGGARAPIIVTERMVSEMKAGAVIIDVSIDQGGVFETSRPTNHSQPTFKTHSVIHYCVPNIPSRVARTASYAFSNLLAPMLITMGEEGGFDALIRKDMGIRKGVYVYNGILTNKALSETFKLPYKDINLLTANPLAN
ncbi:MAG: alanine dehydrogenase [Bacteroidetes bacterium]|nr:MAG: alanine dehydrogenase [Bacteroidota bacterium]